MTCPGHMAGEQQGQNWNPRLFKSRDDVGTAGVYCLADEHAKQKQGQPGCYRLSMEEFTPTNGRRLVVADDT